MTLGLEDNVLNKIITTIKKYKEVEEILIYGSRAKGNYKPGSDIDIALKGSELNLSTLYTIEEDLEELFLPYKMDLSLFKNIDNKELIDHINRVGIKLL